MEAGPDSGSCLAKLAPWFEEGWMAARELEIGSQWTQSGVPANEILAAIPTLAAYQTFRARSRALA